MTAVITDLRDRWGLSDSEIARAVHTHPNVVRRWRNGVEPNPDEVARADLLNDFCDDLHDLGFEPGAFLSDLLVEGYTATGWDLYAAGRPMLLLAYGRGEISGAEMLAAHDPDWQRTYWTSFKTVQAEDGNVSVVGKSYDDVFPPNAGSVTRCVASKHIPWPAATCNICGATDMRETP